MTARKMSYADVRDTVTSVLGPDCLMTDIEMEVFYSNCLNQMWVDLRDSKYFCQKWTLTLNPGDFSTSVPPEMYQIDRIYDPVTCVDIPEGEPECMPCTVVKPGCSCSSCDCEPLGKWGERKIVKEEPVKPTEWWCDTDENGLHLIFSPKPAEQCELTVEGFRRVDCTLWDDEVLESGDKVRNWRLIDLPAPYHSVFVKCVIGMAFAASDDPGMGDYWRGVAADEMRALLGTGDVLNTPKSEVFCIGGETRHNCPSSFLKEPNLAIGAAFKW